MISQSSKRQPAPAFVVPKWEIRWLLDRLHVGTSPSRVIREIARRMPRDRFTKANRKACYRFAIAQHQQNQHLYHIVTGSI